MAEPKPANDEPKAVDPVGIFTAVLAVLGAAGWITFIGGAILWIGFAQAGLPAAETVARIPTSTLIATGAEFLTWAVLAAVLVIGGLAFIDGFFSWIQKGSEDSRLEVLLKKRTAAKGSYDQAVKDLADAELSSTHRKTELTEAQAAVARRVAANLDEDSAEMKSAREAVQVREGEVRAAVVEVSKRQSAKDAASTKRKDAREKYAKASGLKSPAFHRILLLGLALGAVTALIAHKADLGYGSGSGLPAMIIVYSLAVGAFGAAVFLRTSQLRALAVVAFFGIPLVMAAALYERASDVPEVQPVAVMLKSGDPLVGVFVAQTTERVVVGTFERVSPTDPEPGAEANQKIPVSLQTLANEDVAGVLVGPRLPLLANDAAGGDGTQPRSAREWAGRTALALCASARKRALSVEKRAEALSGGAAAPTSTATDAPVVLLPKGCSSIQREDLHKFLNTETAIINEG